jgi:hypothetical protein
MGLLAEDEGWWVEEESCCSDEMSKNTTVQNGRKPCVNSLLVLFVGGASLPLAGCAGFTPEQFAPRIG